MRRISRKEEDARPQKEMGHLPNRFWIQSENGRWYSVARGSQAHKDNAPELRYLKAL